MILIARRLLERVTFWATVTTFFQYSSFRAASLVQSTSTSFMSTPAALQTSTKYLPTLWIAPKSPPIFPFSQANQSAIQSLKWTPACWRSAMLSARSTPNAMFASPLGSNPS